MKLCIVIQSDAFRTSAGMRIRYDRFSECLVDPDVTFDTLTCAEIVAAKKLRHDVYIFCKTFDTTALLLARRIRAAGKVVGQDLFDDYFSQYDDPRLERFREWMRDMAPVTQFAICSTPRMVEVLRYYLPDIRIVSIEDPIIGFAPLMVAARADAKAARARKSKAIEVAWFGIGDNPYFPVGLTDLVACDAALARIEQRGWKVTLRIVTNRRAFEGGAAELLRRLSVDFELVEWTEQVEQEALARATIAILPVNGQSFSRAKSMNRAVTALSGGCQVLSLGYPLYQPLDAFIYRSIDDLLDDLASKKARVGSAHIDALNAALATLANPFEAATAFVREAQSAMALAGKPQIATNLCLIHGRATTIGLHKLVGGLRGLSVGTYFNKSSWNFHVRFDAVDNRVVMRVDQALTKRFELPLRNRGETIRIRDLEFVEVDVDALGIAPLPIFLTDEATPIENLALYEDVMRHAQDCCRAAFAPADMVLSDSSPLHRRPRESVTVPEVLVEEAVEAQVEEDTLVLEVDDVVDELPPELMASPARRSRFLPVSKAQRRERALALFEASALFDRDWYLESYPDVAAGGSDPAHHYYEFGWREGRDPGPRFSTKLYLKAYRDVVQQQVNPLLHFLDHGRAEGRRISASMTRVSEPAGADVE